MKSSISFLISVRDSILSHSVTLILIKMKKHVILIFLLTLILSTYSVSVCVCVSYLWFCLCCFGFWKVFFKYWNYILVPESLYNSGWKWLNWIIPFIRSQIGEGKNGSRKETSLTYSHWRRLSWCRHRGLLILAFKGPFQLNNSIYVFLVLPLFKTFTHTGISRRGHF